MNLSDCKNEAGDIIGHIMLSEINLKADDQRYKALELALIVINSLKLR